MFSYSETITESIGIYLAGTIYKQNEIGFNWKDSFINQLKNSQVSMQSDYTFLINDPNPSEGVTKESKFLVNRDKQTIDESKILVAYISKVTFGTTMEIFYAYSNNKIVIVIDPMKQFRDDLWLNYHSHYIVDTPGEAACFISEIQHSRRNCYVIPKSK